MAEACSYCDQREIVTHDKMLVELVADTLPHVSNNLVTVSLIIIMIAMTKKTKI